MKESVNEPLEENELGLRSPKKDTTENNTGSRV